MADFAGEIFSFPGGLDPTNRSTSVTAGVFAATILLGLGSFPLAADRGVPEPAVSISHQNLSGERVEMFGGQLFEKVIVIPRVKVLGFVLTATQFAVEVWNAFRDVDQTLQSITISGVGGLTFPDPYGVPLIYAALGSRIYQATVPSSGAAQIDQMVVFAFLSGVSGADL